MARNSYAAFYLRNFCQCLIFWRTRTSAVPVRFFCLVGFLHEKCISFELSFSSKRWCFKGVCREDTNQHERMPKLNNHQMMLLALNLKALRFQKLQTCPPEGFCFTQVQLILVRTDLQNLQTLFGSYFFQAVFSRVVFFLCVRCTKKKSAAYLPLNYLVDVKSK